MLNSIIDSITMLVWNLKEGYGFNMTSIEGVGLSNLFKYLQFRNNVEGAIFMFIGVFCLLSIGYCMYKVIFDK